MRYYTVHLPRGLAQSGDKESNARQALGSALFVREGFNWGAFFFSILWAIGHGMWLGALAMAALLALIVGLPEIFALDWASRAVLLIGYLFFCGFNGNDWLRAGLNERGWEISSVIAARDQDHAVMRLARLLRRDEESESAATAAPQTAPAAPRLDIGPSPGFWS
jgi:hypothetical protein